MSQNDYIENLSSAQKQAVTNYQNHSLIIAGAGSGKTRVLTCRIAHMIANGISPYSILALTFTNKAAREMRERIETIVPADQVRGLAMGTFHSIFARILRREASLLGYPDTFSIYDTSETKSVIKEVLKSLELSDETYKPNSIASRISLAKNNLITPAAYTAHKVLIDEDNKRKIPRFNEVYKAYCQKCRENGAMDFDDLLLNMNILFRDHPQALQRYQERWRYILVDEYQDTNTAQYLIIKKLTEQGSTLCVVGDDAQSIYSFRGAKIENILRFKKDFPAADTFKLEQNYRSTQTIVNAANSVIEKNSNRLKKTSFSDGEKGELIRVNRAYTDKEEAAITISQLSRLVLRGNYNDAAILYRTNAQSRVIEDALRSRNIPYRIYGGHSFYQRKEIKDLLAYIALIINPKDDEALRRIINYPARGIGNVTIARIATAAKSQGISMWETIQNEDLLQFDIRGAAANKIKDFVAMILSLQPTIQTQDAYAVANEIALRSGIIQTLRNEHTPEATSAIENIEELLNSVKEFVDNGEQEDFMSDIDSTGMISTMSSDEVDNGQNLIADSGSTVLTIDKWYSDVKLLTDTDTQDENGERVTLTTVHSVKGLEFDYVFIVGLEENLFPSLMSIGEPSGLEEERRLFYVALTRAKKRAVLSFAKQRFNWGEITFSQPSRFIKEIDPKYLDIDFSLSQNEHEEQLDEDRSSLGMWDSTASSYRYQQQRQSYNNRASRIEHPYDRYRTENQTAQQRQLSQQQMADRVAQRITQAANRIDEAKEALRRAEQAIADGRLKRVAVRRADSCPSEAAPSYIRKGMVVEHSKFGRGIVIDTEQLSGDLKLTIEFSEGRKTLLNRFAKLRIL